MLLQNLLTSAFLFLFLLSSRCSVSATSLHPSKQQQQQPTIDTVSPSELHALLPPSFFSSPSVHTLSTSVRNPNAFKPKGLGLDPCYYHRDCLSPLLCVKPDFSSSCSGSANCFCLRKATQLCKSCTACSLYPEESCLYLTDDKTPGKTDVNGVCASLYVVYEGIAREPDCNSIPPESKHKSCRHVVRRTPAGYKTSCSCSTNGKSEEVWNVVAAGVAQEKIRACYANSLAAVRTCRAGKLPAYARIARRLRTTCCALYGGRVSYVRGVPYCGVAPPASGPGCSGNNNKVLRIATGFRRCGCGKDSGAPDFAMHVASGIDAWCVKKCLQAAPKCVRANDANGVRASCCSKCNGSFSSRNGICQNVVF